jgi:signal peptidase I
MKMTSETIKSWAKDIAIAVVVAVCILQFIRPTVVKEHSMLETLNENDYLIVTKQAYLFKDPGYKDIIVFKSNLTTDNGKAKLLIKRVIGLPGETIEITDGKVYINGEQLVEDYIGGQLTAGSVAPIVIPEGKIFVMGDNRGNSADSRDERIGLVDEKTIYGEAVFRLYPFNEIGLI